MWRDRIFGTIGIIMTIVLLGGCAVVIYLSAVNIGP